MRCVLSRGSAPVMCFRVSHTCTSSHTPMIFASRFKRPEIMNFIFFYLPILILPTQCALLMYTVRFWLLRWFRVSVHRLIRFSCVQSDTFTNLATSTNGAIEFCWTCLHAGNEFFSLICKSSPQTAQCCNHGQEGTSVASLCSCRDATPGRVLGVRLVETLANFDWRRAKYATI